MKPDVMNTSPMVDNPHYNPAQLLDTLLHVLQLRNDAQLARALDLGPPSVSKVRKKRSPVTPEILLRMHEESNISIKELRAMMGDFRPHTRPSARHPTVRELHTACPERFRMSMGPAADLFVSRNTVG
jgi:hypothetical protein